jgi:hypothetical protein
MVSSGKVREFKRRNFDHSGHLSRLGAHRCSQFTSTGRALLSCPGLAVDVASLIIRALDSLLGRGSHEDITHRSLTIRFSV